MTVAPTAPRSVAPALPARPRLAADVELHAPTEPGTPWLVERVGRGYFRVGADVARLAGTLDGGYDQGELLVVLGRPWTAEVLEGALRRLQDLKLLDDGQPRSTKLRRVTVAPPFSLQFTVLDPSRILRSAAGLIDRLSSRAALTVFAAVVVAGLVALGVQAGTVVRLVSEPISALVFVVIFAGNFVATVIHELAHGAVLTRYGGRPRRMGFMLFYLLPAFFCDVSDGWRLPRNAMRVRVALAGIAAQLVVAGTVGLAALPVLAGPVHDALVLLSVVIFVAASVNVIPLVKFDGYLALMSHLDISDLRTKSMDDARGWLARRLYGGTAPERELPGRRWVVPYGLACIVFPMLLLTFAGVVVWSGVFARMGYVGAMVNISLLAALVAGVGRELVRLHRLAHATRPGRLARVVAVDAVLAAFIVLALTQVSLTRTVPAGYELEADGTATLYVTSASDADAVRTGQEVELRANGVLLRPQVGSAVVAPGDQGRAEISMTRFTPLDADVDLGTRVVTVPITVEQTPDDASGVARVVTGERSLGRWLYESYLAPLW